MFILSMVVNSVLPGIPERLGDRILYPLLKSSTQELVINPEPPSNDTKQNETSQFPVEAHRTKDPKEEANKINYKKVSIKTEFPKEHKLLGLLSGYINQVQKEIANYFNTIASQETSQEITENKSKETVKSLQKSFKAINENLKNIEKKYTRENKTLNRIGTIGLAGAAGLIMNGVGSVASDIAGEYFAHKVLDPTKECIEKLYVVPESQLQSLSIPPEQLKDTLHKAPEINSTKTAPQNIVISPDSQ